MAAVSTDKRELFENTPVPKALAAMAIPTVISQLVGLLYNMVDAFFLGRTGNSYMMAATTLTLTLVLMTVALGNLFGVGGGSLVARLNGARKPEQARSVSAFSFFGACGIGFGYAFLVGCFLVPLLNLLGASEATLGYAKQYTLLVIVLGGLPSILTTAMAHHLRNVGCARQASVGMSSGCLLNIALDPLFMFVLLPDGYEVFGAGLATLLSNLFSCVYLLNAYKRAGENTPLCMKPSEAKKVEKQHIARILAVGVPSAILTGLYDIANIVFNMLTAAHGDLVLAGMGIVLKVERLPTTINLGICQGMMPIVSYNYSSGNHERMKKTIATARLWGLTVSAVSILLFLLFAAPVTRAFLDVSAGNAEEALLTLGFAAVFLRLRCVASPVQFLNFHTSFCMQAMGNGKGTMLHAVVRELGFYIPFMFLLNHFFGANGLASALVLGEACGAAFALYLLSRFLKKKK